jgi:hypothetical protein
MKFENVDYADHYDFSKRFSFKCNGSDKTSGSMRVPPNFVGMYSVIDICLGYPDCTCKNYRTAVDVMESMEEQEDSDISGGQEREDVIND